MFALFSIHIVQCLFFVLKYSTGNNTQTTKNGNKESQIDDKKNIVAVVIKKKYCEMVIMDLYI